MLKTPFKKLLSLMLTVAMVVSFFPATVMADESGASDLEGHWASEVMTEWIGYGIIAGYEDGTVRPDKSITRAEMTAMLDRVMGYQTMAANHFSDLDDNWYTEVILKGNAAGVISGYEDGTVRPNATISRQEATAMIARVLALDTENVPEADFTDSDAVADWAKDAVNAMAAKGYVNGSDGQFRPTAGMTRAEVVTILNNIFDKLYDENVTYISDSNGSAVINADDVTLKNLTVSGDLIVAQGVGDGHVVLDGVTVAGRLIVRGGGENSVIIRGDSKIGSVSVERIDGAVRVAVEGGASVSMISVADGSDTVTLQGNIGSLNIDNNNADVVVNGSVDDLNVLGQNATVEINGSVETLAVEGTNADLTIGGELTTVDIAAGASEASITIQPDGSVGTLITAAEKTTVTAQGDVTTVTVEETAADAEINIQSTSSVQNLTTSAQNTTVNVAGTVESISVNNGANNATITVDEDATASTITTDAANTTINGDGSVENVTVDENATGATVTTPGTSVENNSDEVVIVGEDETIGAGTTGTTPGGTTPTPTPDPTPTPTPDPEPEPVYYTVTYMNGAQTVTTQSVEANTAATAPTAETVGENWPDISKGNKLTWYNGAEPYNFETPVTGNLTLTAVIGSDDFQAGNGTEKYPYLISTLDQFKAINNLSEAMTSGTTYYFKQIADIKDFASSAKVLRGVYDGNDCSISAIGDGSVQGMVTLFSNVYGTTNIQNLNLVSNKHVGLTVTADPWGVDNLTISGINATATEKVVLNQANYAFLMAGCVFDAREDKAAERQKVTVENCTVNASVENTAHSSGGFLGSGYYPAQQLNESPVLTVRNCSMTGSIVGNTQAGVVYGNPAYLSKIDTMMTNSNITDEADRIAKVKEIVVVDNITFNGVVKAKQAGIFGSNNQDLLLNKAYKDKDTLKGEYIISDAVTNPLDALDLRVYTSESGFGINNDRYSYNLVFRVSAINLEDGVMNSRDIIIPLSYVAESESSELLQTGTSVHAYDTNTAIANSIITAVDVLDYKYVCEGIPVAIVAQEGKTYLIFDSDHVKSVDSSVNTYVYGYTNDEYIGSKTINQTVQNTQEEQSTTDVMEEQESQLE